MAKRSAAERQYLLDSKRIDRRADIIQTAIRAGAVVFIFVCVAYSAKALAGQTTQARFFVSLFTDFKLNEFLYMAVGGSGFSYGILQRKLRRDVLRELGELREAREAAVDPHRSSSRLTERGTTPKGLL